MILAGNGYLDGIDGETEARVMPIDNYILATAPIGAGMPGGIIPGGEAVSDSRFVVYYFRPTADGRLVFGGGETYSRNAPADIAGFVRRHLTRIYPQLGRSRIDYAWGGTLAITLRRLPFIRQAAARRLRRGRIFRTRRRDGAVRRQGARRCHSRRSQRASIFSPACRLRLSRAESSCASRRLAAGMMWYALRDRL